MLIRQILIIALLLPWLATAEPARTGADEITAAATAYLIDFTANHSAAKTGRLSFEVGKIDPRINFNACPTPLSVKLTSDAETSVRNTLLVACDGDMPWKLFVSADITIEAQVWVSRMPLARGMRVQPSHLAQEWRTMNTSSRGVFTGPASQITGMILRRNMAPGEAFSASSLTAPTAVNRGDSVMITARSATIGIESPGTALADGRIGEQISVRNNGSNRVIRAFVTERGRVEVVF